MQKPEYVCHLIHTMGTYVGTGRYFNRLSLLKNVSQGTQCFKSGWCGLLLYRFLRVSNANEEDKEMFSKRHFSFRKVLGKIRCVRIVHMTTPHYVQLKIPASHDGQEKASFVTIKSSFTQRIDFSAKIVILCLRGKRRLTNHYRSD